MRFKVTGNSRLAALVCILVGVSSHAFAQTEPVRFQLDNGLRVIVKADQRVPTVITQVWYRVGSADEVPGKTGISHVLEHMMFKGTPIVPAGEFSRLVTYFGGDDNAFTTDNYTVYLQQNLANRLPLALELEADRMHNLALTEADFDSEIQVVMEERRMRTDDVPQGIALERFNAIANVANPERSPTIGWMHDLIGLRVTDAQDWYKKWYAPNNATLVIVGAVDLDQVKQQVEHYFAAIPAQALPQRAAIRELAVPGERELTLHLQAQVPSLYIGFNWPSLATAAKPEDAYALRLLAGILDEGNSSRFDSRLVRTNRAVAISSSYDPFSRGDTVYIITAIPTPTQSLPALRDALMSQLQLLTEQLVSPEEVQRVIANLTAQNVFVQDDISEQAKLLGRLDSNGMSLNLMDTLPAKLHAVTPEQLRDAARRYLRPELMTTLFVEAIPRGQQP